jgi:molybdopterin-guanine dinucleotide biosynthesis protein A
VRGAVLAGGAATRFGGQPKGLERVGGERILDRVVAALRAATGSAPTLIANAKDAASWAPGLAVVRDPRPDLGTLGGLYTAITAGDGPVLVVAWDMPFVPVELLEAVVAGAQGYDVFLPESGSRRGVEPLCAVYGAACRAAIERQLASDDLRAIGFHGDVRVGRLPLATVRSFGPPEELFFNINEPADLERAEALWRRRG